MEYERCVKIVFQLSGLQNLTRFFFSSYLSFTLFLSVFIYLFDICWCTQYDTYRRSLSSVSPLHCRCSVRLVAAHHCVTPGEEKSRHHSHCSERRKRIDTRMHAILGYMYNLFFFWNLLHFDTIDSAARFSRLTELRFFFYLTEFFFFLVKKNP